MMRDSFNEVFQWAHDAFGFELHLAQQERLVSRIKCYLKKNKINEKQFLSKFKKGEQDFIDDLIDLLTIQESYFFRDQSLFLLLKNHFLPRLIQQKKTSKYKQISIWSAGCAKGEEIYSLAILLSELIPDLETWKLRLIGSDINHDALVQAKQACYSSLALRATDEKRKETYFSKEQSDYQLCSSIRDMVTFNCGNILENPLHQGPFDIILCRNVFIYLDSDAIDKALFLFETELKHEGLLFLGTSDFIRYQNHNFYLHFKDNVSYLNTLKPKLPGIDLSKKIEISYERKTKTKVIKNKPSFVRQQKKRVDELEALRHMLQNKQFTEALDVINKSTRLFNFNSVLYRYKGEALIGLGDIATAKEVLEQAIKQDAMDAKSYFLLALVLMDSNIREAEKMLHKAIYIKQEFPEAHYHLAMLYFGQQQSKLGKKHLVKAKTYAEQQSRDANVIGSDENMGDLIEVIEREITHYQGASS